jgi:hypothetical protein
LRDEWARRGLKIVVRDSRQLSGTSRLMLEHLQAAERQDTVKDAVRDPVADTAKDTVREITARPRG